MSGKRDKRYPPSLHRPASISKRRRPNPVPSVDEITVKSQPPPALLVTGLSSDCAVLDLKSRFEIYGAISRIRMDRDGIGYVTYRHKDSAEAAINAAIDPSFGITLHSQKVEVMWATDPLAQWREGIVACMGKGKGLSSKLVRAELPLRRHGRCNKLASAIVNPKSNTNILFKGREIVAYDDIL